MSPDSRRADKRGAPAARPPAPGSLTSDLRQFTRGRLLKAALDAFTQQGYKGTSVERIAELAGTTTPTFYRHFSSKIEILPHLSHHLAQEVSAVFARLDMLVEPRRAEIRAWLDDFVAMWSRMHWLCDAFWEAVKLDETVASNVLPDTMGAVAVAERLLSRHAADKQERLKARLAMLVFLLDRVLAVNMAIKDARLSDLMMDEAAAIIWLSIYGDRDL